MQRTRTWMALAALTAIVGGVGGVAFAASDRRPSALRSETLTFDRREVQKQDVDLEPRFTSMGDQHLFASDLSKGGTRTGREYIACTTVRVEPEQWQCVVTLTLRRGQITAQGFHVPGEDAQVAITGGTGRYRRVGGVVSYSAAGIVVVLRIQYL